MGYFMTHFHVCQEERKEAKAMKAGPKYDPLPPLENNYDDSIRNKGQFKSDSTESSKENDIEAFKPPFKERIKLVIKGANSR